MCPKRLFVSQKQVHGDSRLFMQSEKEIATWISPLPRGIVPFPSELIPYPTTKGCSILIAGKH